MKSGLVEAAVVAFGAFALLFPRSPFTIAMLRERGPRRDHSVLLRGEIRESARGFATFAIAAAVATACVLVVTDLATPRRDEEKLPYYFAVLFCGLLSAYFAWQALRAWVIAAVRSDAREAELVRKRLGDEAPRELDGPALRHWLAGRGAQLAPAPPPKGRSVDDILGFPVATHLLVVGLFLALGGAGVVIWTLHSGDVREGIASPIIAASLGAALVALAVRLDRAGGRAGSR
jgi:hypothetical protein